MIAELAEDGNLLKTLEKNGWDHDLGGKYMLEVATGMNFLHNQFNLRHFDLKPKNILVHQGVAKIGDFGMARPRTNSAESSRLAPYAGTEPYMAHEVFRNKGEAKSDVFSFGVMMYEVFSKGLRPARSLDPMEPVQVSGLGGRELENPARLTVLFRD